MDEDEQPFWIGVTANPDSRRREHKWLRKGVKFYFLVIFEGLTEEQALAEEEKLILAIGRQPDGPLLNQAVAQHRGHKLSEATRQKMSASRSGVKRPVEVGQKVALALKGRIRSEEHKQNISKAKKGKPLSQEHADRIKAAKNTELGRVNQLAGWEKRRARKGT